MIYNPFQAFQSFGGMTQQANPFEAWQKLWMQGVQQSAQAVQAVQPQPKPQLPQPMDMFSQFSAMQNMWLSAVAPQLAPTPGIPAMQAPKITVTTIELGDMRPYMDMASSMLQAFSSFGQPVLGMWGRK